MFVPLHVEIVATPDVVGVHAKTRSGAALLEAQAPARVLVPLVVPVNVPPAAGIVTTPAQPPTAGVAVAVGSVTGVLTAVVVGTTVTV